MEECAIYDAAAKSMAKNITQGVVLACALSLLSAASIAGTGQTQLLTSSNGTEGCPANQYYSDRFNPAQNDRFNLRISLYGTPNYGTSSQIINTVSTSNSFDVGTGLVYGSTAKAMVRNNWNQGYPESINYFSAFQLGCGRLGSFINTWTWPQGVVPGGGPNTGYQITFTTPKPVYDATFNEFWLQVDNTSLPWVASWGGIGQLVLGAFIQYTSPNGQKQSFQFLSELYDSRSNWNYLPYVGMDGSMPYATAPNSLNAFNSPGPSVYGFSSMRTGLSSWSNQKFRSQISRTEFAQIVSQVEAKCSSLPNRSQIPHCANSFIVPDVNNPNDPAWTRYKLSALFLLHEVFYTGLGHISMGINAQGIGAYRYSRPGYN